MSPLFARPIAHRGLHDRAAGRMENSRAAFHAALARDYAIELDLQLSADGEAVVFHDDELDRLTGEAGPLRARRAAELGGIALSGGSETIPMLEEVLALVAGRVPLVIELKDQGGRMDATDVGPLEARVAALLRDYAGPACVMSFNPASVAEIARRAPDLPRGLVAGPAHWFPELPPARAAALAELSAAEAIGAQFVSYDATALPHPRLSALRAAGLPVLSWTLRSAEAAARALAHCDQITFESFAP